MSLDGRAVDHGQIRCGAGVDQLGEQLLPQPAFAPAVEAIVDRRAWPVGARQRPPAAALAQNEKDAADDPSVVNPHRAGVDLRQQRLDPPPLPIIQPAMIRCLPAS